MPCQRSKVVRSSTLASKMYLPGSSRLWDEFEMVIATSSRPTIGLMRTGLCITTFSARIAAACSAVGGPASRSLRSGCMMGVPSYCRLLSSKFRHRRYRQSDVRGHAPSFRRVDPHEDHQERFGDRRLAGVRNGDVDRNVCFDDVGAERDDFLFLVVRIDPKWTGLLELVEVGEDHFRPPKTGPIAFGCRCRLGDEKCVRRVPHEASHCHNVMTVLGVDQLSV